MYSNTSGVQKQHNTHKLYGFRKYNERITWQVHLPQKWQGSSVLENDAIVAQTFVHATHEIESMSAQITTAVVPCNTKQYVMLHSNIHGVIDVGSLHKLQPYNKYYAICKLTHAFRDLDYTLLYQRIQFGRFFSGTHTITLGDNDIDTVANLFNIERALIRSAYLQLDTQVLHPLTNKVLLDQCMYNLMTIPCLAYGYDERHVYYEPREHNIKPAQQLNFAKMTQVKLRQAIIDSMERLYCLLLAYKEDVDNLQQKTHISKSIVSRIECAANVSMYEYKHMLAAFENGENIISHDTCDMTFVLDVRQDACIFLANIYKSKRLLAQSCILRIEHLLKLGHIWMLTTRPPLHTVTFETQKAKHKSKSHRHILCKRP